MAAPIERISASFHPQRFEAVIKRVVQREVAAKLTTRLPERIVPRSRSRERKSHRRGPACPTRALRRGEIEKNAVSELEKNALAQSNTIIAARIGVI